ncbi:HET-domain-containing protein [Hypoxylon rubiginosum]|uniref:HET-domain-containing protein n=1 Tax=Hypoxylon rubiginosum TaxID=110542 RepID=A0ACB9YVZ7_9PEZI|nr:HET-domain-containing protein [Hypoxylon rubiginosum]
MRLIDINTLELKQFFDPSKMPPYAILSHTWNGDQEVTYQEWGCRNSSTVQRKDGYAKIMGACRRARADGLQYLWCDTNCIDKSSSAELTEAINSMFAWYRDSHICYAYLADVKNTDTFANSRWLARGWTLQELLAPVIVVFFDCHWTVLGDRKGMASVLSSITRIHVGALRDRLTIRDYSIAQRMSWAAGRQTSREEDIAYCLLGIFDINMPLLYGEGQKAFSRLQQEIIKVSDDQSILAWELRSKSAHQWTSALAPSPAGFRFCGSIVRDWDIKRGPYSVTNLGISMNLPVIKTHHVQTILVGLNCVKELRGTTTANPTHLHPTQARHPFQVWIPLYQSERDIYLRGHYPPSNIFLGISYPLLARPKTTNLFLAIDTSQRSTSYSGINLEGVAMVREPISSPSGLLVTVASGKLMPEGHVFKEIYPLQRFSISSLRNRCSSKLSHHLISSGNLTTVVSVYWDKDQRPQQWSYTTIANPEMQAIHQMSYEEDWHCFFGKCVHPSSTGCNTVAGLHSLHTQLRQTPVMSMGKFAKEVEPLITISSQPLRDLNNSLELIVDVIFRK